MKRRFLIFLLLGFAMMEIASGQGEIMRSRLERENEREKRLQKQKEANLPQPAILDEDLIVPTLKISEFVRVSENTGIKDDRVTMGVRQLLEETFSDSRYKLVDDDNANFVVTAEIVYVGRPDEAFSIIGIFNRRKTETEVRMNVLVQEVATGRVMTGRGTGTIETNITATALQIEETLPFNQSELGGAVRKAIDKATESLK
jgi:hypothetical protein|tara:strand:- start:898 stop:1503 length:606 start_codon:yes stop_codon:yes gene_type:complete